MPRRGPEPLNVTEGRQNKAITLTSTTISPVMPSLITVGRAPSLQMRVAAAWNTNAASPEERRPFGVGVGVKAIQDAGQMLWRNRIMLRVVLVVARPVVIEAISV